MAGLDLGWCQGYMGLKYHAEDAFFEKGITRVCSPAPPYTLFAINYINKIKSLDHTKIYDYCFIGSINNSSSINRRWVIEFASTYFTENSIFINTDNSKDWKSLGVFDKTLTDTPRFNPRTHPSNQSRSAQWRDVSENQYYFETMCKSKFCLCPAGDASWSFRFYEALMCETIPIVTSWHHTYRTREEASIPYRYYLKQEPHTHVFSDEVVSNNLEILERFHTLH